MDFLNISEAKKVKKKEDKRKEKQRKYISTTYFSLPSVDELCSIYS